MKKPRTIISIDAHGVADFRRQLDAAVAQAQLVAEVPVLPTKGSASEEALINALADIVERLCVVQSPAEQQQSA